MVVERGDELVGGRIVETEAYTRDDPASHSFNGPTVRNAVMFGPPGRLYVYLSYGIHRCANVVTGGSGDGQAVLLRAICADVRSRRDPGAGAVRRPERALTDGPGKLCEALAIDLDDSGLDLTDPASPVRILDDGTPPPDDPIVGPRVGISKAVDIPWRFRVPARRPRYRRTCEQMAY